MQNLIDLERYPLHRLHSKAGQKLVASCREDLGRRGMFTLRQFMRREIIDQILPELLRRLENESFTHARKHNIYFDDEITDIPGDHPALAHVETINHTLCGDQIAAALRQIYLWPHLTEFLAQVMQKPALFPMADPLACTNVMAYYEGEGLNWHFDRSEFTTTLLLQQPCEGGEFQFRHALRSTANPNYDGVAKLLCGEDSEVSTLQLGAGDLNVFKGVDTAHRVTPPVGERARVVTVFTYYETPGRVFTDKENLGFYGRANAKT